MTIENYILVNDLPELAANYSSDLLNANFSSITSRAETILWEFGDGNSSSEASPMHTYETDGQYEVTVTAMNECGVRIENLIVDIVVLPVAQFSSDPGLICSGQTVNYTDASSENTTSWNWSFPGGTPSTSIEQNPIVSYDTPGVYSASLTVGNTAGSATLTSDNIIEVITTPEASYTSDIEGNVLRVSNTTAGTTAAWNFGDGDNSIQQAQDHIYTANGTYLVRLEVANACGTDIEEFEVTIDAYPESAFTVVNTNPACAPHSVTFENNSLKGTSFLWQFPGGTPASSVEMNPEVTYDEAGDYEVSLEVFNSYGTDLPDFTSTANGSTIIFTNSSSMATSYSWDFGDGKSSNEENPMHQYDIADSYVVTLMVENACGVASLSQTVVVDFSLPEISTTFSVTEGCVPLEVQLTDESTNDPTSWMWEFPGGEPATSTEQNPTVVYNQAGNYTINARVSNADGSSSLEFLDVVTVESLPTSEFNVTVFSETINLENNSVGATEYSWDFGDGKSSQENSPEHSYASSGSYEITLIATNDCGSVESTQVVVIELSSVFDEEYFGNWVISPNPSTGDISLMFDKAISENLNYKLIDMVGRVIISDELLAGTKNQNLTVEERGIYLMVLTKDGDTAVKKLSIVK